MRVANSAAQTARQPSGVNFYDVAHSSVPEQQRRQVPRPEEQPHDEHAIGPDLVEQDVVAEPGDAPLSHVRRKGEPCLPSGLRITGDQIQSALDGVAETVRGVGIDGRQVVTSSR